jgi:aspartate kinase
MSVNGVANGVVVWGGGVKRESRRNDSEGGWIVQKFGGTSVGKFAGNIAEDIVRYVLLERSRDSGVVG